MCHRALGRGGGGRGVLLDFLGEFFPLKSWPSLAGTLRGSQVTPQRCKTQFLLPLSPRATRDPNWAQPIWQHQAKSVPVPSWVAEASVPWENDVSVPRNQISYNESN